MYIHVRAHRHTDACNYINTLIFFLIKSTKKKCTLQYYASDQNAIPFLSNVLMD